MQSSRSHPVASDFSLPPQGDLLTPVLEASHQDGQHIPPADRRAALRCLEALMFDANCMRFFLGAVVEAGDSTELRKVLAEHAAALARQIGEIFERPDNDPAVTVFVDRLRGAAIRVLPEPKRHGRQKTELADIAAEYGLN